MITIRCLLLRLSLCTIALCTLVTALAAQAKEPITFTPPSQLTATATNRDIDLHWKYTATAPGGCWVEFTTPGDDYVKLDATWPEAATYRHLDVVPDTKFIYRILPFFGGPSPEIEITTGKPKPGARDLEEEGPMPESESESKAKSVGKKTSIRVAETFAAAAPDGLTAKLSTPINVELRWTDHATDEDGFVVEIAGVGDKVFQLCALLPPDTTSFRKIQLPPETKCRFRVRAFFYGEPSDSVSILTPSEAPRKKAETKD